jgi:hypothetical protein
MTCEKGTRTSSNPMSIHRLESTLYISSYSWHNKTINHPDWETVKQTILQMDKFYRPIVVLVLENANTLCLNGDKDAWHIQKYEAKIDTYSEAVNPRGDDTEVAVWTSDQGFSTTWQHAFNDREKVLEIANYVYNTGEFPPFLTWE